MLKVTHLTPDAYRVQPWKNGQGETREIAVDSVTPFRWRVSWAAMDFATPFSPYPGYDRQLVLLGGGPVVLTMDEKDIALKPLSPIAFSGDKHVCARTKTAAEDFNVFTLRGSAKAGVYPSFLRPGEELQFPLGQQEHFLFCVEGEMEVFESTTEENYKLIRRETLHVSRQNQMEYLNLRARGIADRTSCLWVTMQVYGGD